MDSATLQKKWPALRQKIKSNYPTVNEQDLIYEIGKEEELLIRLGQKLKMNREQIDNWLNLMG